ncbi:MAG: hypothetical protein ABIQ95_17375, partial [Bdellovibrionia bacterium]
DRGYHSYVNRGKPALSAGMIKFEDYKISYIDNDSGHYKPKESHLTEAVKKLTEKYGDKIFSKTFTIDTEFKPFNRHLITSATELYHLAPLLSEEQKNVGIVYVTLDKMKSINEIILENKDLFEKAKIDLPKKDAKKLLKELEDIQSLTFGWNPETEKKVILGIVGYFESQFILQFQLELKGIEEQLNLRKKAIEKEDVGLNAKASRIDLESIHRALAYIKEVQDTMENLRHCSHQETPLMTSLVVSLNRLRSELSLDKITVRLGLSGTSSATSNLLEQLKKSTQGKISIFSDVNDLYSSYRIFQNIYFDRIAETSKVAINEFYFQLHRKKISIEEIRKIIHKLDERAQDIMDETELWDQLTTPLFAAPEYFKLMKEIAVKKEKAFTEARPSAHPAKKLKHRLRATDVIH